MSLPTDLNPQPAHDADAALAATSAVAVPPTRSPQPVGDGVLATGGLALAAVVLAAMGVLGYLASKDQSAAAAGAEAARVRAVAAALAPALEAQLAQDDLSAARLILTDPELNQGLSRCRVVLPNGQVLSSMRPGEVTAKSLPEQWTGRAAPSDASPDELTVTKPLQIGGRGVAFLQMSAPLPPGTGSAQWVSAAAAVGTAGVAGVLAAYRRARRRLRAMSVVRDALLAVAPEGVARSAGVPVNPALGPEAVAWNALMAEREQVKKDALAERARDALGRRKQVRGDLDAACDAMSQGLLLVDEAGRVKYANGSAATFLRTDREKLVGSDLGGLPDVAKVAAAVRDVASGVTRRRVAIDVERQPEPGRKPGPDDATGVLRFSVRPVRREDSAAAMVVIEDITQQRAAEAARHAFVAQTAHELRTPLTNIRLYVETAIEDGEADPAIRTKALNVINSEARRLERVVGEMLSVAEIEAGAFKLKADDVRLEALFDEVRHDYAEQAKEKRVALSFVLPPKLPVLHADRDKVTVILQNLVGNALKYTSPGGSVTVRVDADDRQLAVAVADTGIGIAPDECERVFERFFRSADGRVAKITGTGLGLTIAREAARLHGGEIGVESQLNRGSTFTLTLPLRAAA